MQHNILLYMEKTDELDEYLSLLQPRCDAKVNACRKPGEAIEAARHADIIFGAHLPQGIYSEASNLKWVQSTWAGVERFLDSGFPLHVKLTRPVGVFGPYISSYVCGMLLSWFLKFREFWHAQGNCSWSPSRISLLRGLHVGIAGMGSIGNEIARTAKFFEMTVSGLNTDGRSCPYTDYMFSSERIQEFIMPLDVLVNTLPSTKSTKSIFGFKELSLLKSGAVVINVGRGSAIDELALVDWLCKDKHGGAILDVFENEPLPADHPFWKLSNCVVTPHISGPSMPADIVNFFLENYSRFATGRPLLGIVDVQRGY